MKSSFLDAFVVLSVLPYRVVRQFTLMTLVWGVLGMGLGVFIAITLLERSGAGLDFAQCSPLVGANIGIGKQLTHDWELAVTGGVAMSVVQAGHKVREHEVQVDVEANKYLKNGMFTPEMGTPEYNLVMGVASGMPCDADLLQLLPQLLKSRKRNQMR